MSLISIIIITIIGLCYGSFLNVLLHRTLSGESILYPFSKCPKCGNKLYWWHNIPIISFLILRGKCYFCNKTISIRYPIIELGGAVLSLYCFYKYVSIVDAISTIIIISLFLIVAYTDIKVKKISVLQTLFVIVFGMIFNRYDLMNSICGLLIFGGVISASIIFGRIFLKKDTFGIGDIYLAMAFGAVVGYEKLFIFVLYALILQFLFILPQYIMDLIKNREIEILKYLIIFFIACLFLYVSKNITIFGSNLISIVFLGIVIFSAVKLVKNLSCKIINQENVSYSPLAPSLAIVSMFFLC